MVYVVLKIFLHERKVSLVMHSEKTKHFKKFFQSLVTGITILNPKCGLQYKT